MMEKDEDEFGKMLTEYFKLGVEAAKRSQELERERTRWEQKKTLLQQKGDTNTEKFRKLYKNKMPTIFSFLSGCSEKHRVIEYLAELLGCSKCPLYREGEGCIASKCILSEE